MKLDAFKFGLAWAIATAVVIIALNVLLFFLLMPKMGNEPEGLLLATLTGSYADEIPLRGILIATAIWSFIGGTFGTILAWAYNFLVDRG